jgi:DNA polymerase
MKELVYKNAMETSVLGTFKFCFEGGCTRCTLSNNRSNPILYRGNPEAPVMLVGEAPGLREEEQEKPFVGPAGQLLDRIMDKVVGLDTNKDMFLTNCCFCRPATKAGSLKQNYTPKEDQLDKCFPFTKRLIHIIKPKVLIACGRVTLSQLTEDSKISLRAFEGSWMQYDDIPMFVMTYPLSILHQSKWPEQQRQTKLKVWKYMQYFRNTWKDHASSY